MAYVIEKTGHREPLPYLPQHGRLTNETPVEFGHYEERDVEELYVIFCVILEEGQTYPQERMGSVEEFRRYYLSHDAFVLRDERTKEVLGGFYVKPNYPGRSSHICNAGFMVKRSWEGRGVGTFLVPKFLTVARDLGYTASVFNLVYATNTASIKLWQKFGFKEIGRVPKAGNLKGFGYTDALQFYYDLTELP